MENKINILLVDDEFLALQLLENFAQKLPRLNIIGKCKSPIEAMDYINAEKVDILFLDIQMPSLSGNQFLRTLPSPPPTIFTTAYSDFAIEAFELNAVDYLLKPFSFERFVQAVNKAVSHIQQKKEEKESSNFYTAKADGKIIKIFFEDILYVEGLKEYVRFVCPNKKHVVYESLKNLEKILPSKQFLRVHKSFIVAIDKVKSVQGNLLELEGQNIPISRSKREAVIDTIFNLPK